MAQILLPTREAQKQERPQETALDKLVKGLQVAGNVFGIASDISSLQTQSQARDIAEAREGREAAKFGLETQRTTLQAPEGAPGTALTLQTPEGEEVTQLRVPKPKDITVAEKQKQELNQLKIDEARAKLAHDDKKGVRTFDDMNKFRSDYMKNDVTRDTNKVRASYNRIKASAKDPSAAGDLALIFNYMKMLDPGSVVRESEFATAQNAAGVPDRVRALYNRVIDGERMALDQRADFVSRSDALWSSQVDSQKELDEQFQTFADKWGIDTEGIIPKDYDVGGGQIAQQQPQQPPKGWQIPQIIPEAQAAKPFNPQEFLSKRKQPSR